MQLQTAAKPSVLCCHLANTNDELGGLATAIPPFTRLLWFLLKVDACARRQTQMKAELTYFGGADSNGDNDNDDDDVV